MEHGEKKKRSLLDRTADRFDLPGNALGDQPRITMTGSTRILVENHKGLLDYGTEEISVAGNRISLKISGEGLELCAMNAEALLIAGNIFKLELVY